MIHPILNAKSVTFDRNIFSDTPMDHLSLLDPILGNTGCLRSANDVNILVKYMENSSQMISQCIVINILKNTRAPSTLERFVDSKGWAILSNWLKFARENSDIQYLIELIQVLIKFPQTIESLKQGSIGKYVKQLSKSENLELQKCSRNVLIKWKKFLKEQQVPTKLNKSVKCTNRDCVQNSLLDLTFSNSDPNNNILHSSANNLHYQDNDSSGKLDVVLQRSMRPNKPITSDLSSKRIRNNGNYENTTKILPSLKFNLNSYQPNNVNSQFPNSPCVAHSTSPIDELFSKKLDSNSISTPNQMRVQSSPVESKKFSEAIFESSNRRSTSKRNSIPMNHQKSCAERLSMDNILDRNRGELLYATNDAISTVNIHSNSLELDPQKLPKSKFRKHVTWAPEEMLTEVRFIELDDTEFGSIQVHGTFHEAIMQEKRAERSALAHLFTNDRMLALVQWNNPSLIEFLEPLVEPGSKSDEIHNQIIRERSVLALLFLTKDSAPDDPSEPEIEEIHVFKEPKLIPLYEPGKEPLQESNTTSPIKTQLPSPNMYTHSEITTQVFNSVPPPLYNIPMLPFPSQYQLYTTNIIPSLNPTSCTATDNPTIPTIKNNLSISLSSTSPRRETTTFPMNSYSTHVSGTRHFPNFYKKKPFKSSFKSRKLGKNNTPCQHFSKGFCKKGESCDFRH